MPSRVCESVGIASQACHFGREMKENFPGICLDIEALETRRSGGVIKRQVLWNCARCHKKKDARNAREMG